MLEGKTGQFPVMPERVEAAVNRLADIVPEVCPTELRDVLFESKQSSLGKAMLADLLDAVPVVGDIGNFFRVKHAAKVGRERPRRVTRQMVDMLVGIVPDPVGGVLDLLLPMNTVTYLQERGVLQR